MSDVVTQTEARQAEESREALASDRSLWLAKARSVQNLNRFIKGANDAVVERRSSIESAAVAAPMQAPAAASRI